MLPLPQAAQTESRESVERPRFARLHDVWRKLKAFYADQRGELTTEYVVLVGTVGLLVVSAMVSVGPLLLASYERSRAILIGPFP